MTGGAFFFAATSSPSFFFFATTTTAGVASKGLGESGEARGSTGMPRSNGAERLGESVAALTAPYPAKMLLESTRGAAGPTEVGCRRVRMSHQDPHT